MRNLISAIVLGVTSTSAHAAPTLQSTVALAPAGASHKVPASRFLLPTANTNKALKQCSKGGTDAVLDDARFAAVHIDWTGVTFDGKQVVELDGGWLSKEDRVEATLGSLLTPLQSALDGQRQVSKAGCAIGEPAELLILAGRNVHAETLTAVMTTASAAGFRTFAIAVDNAIVNAKPWTPPSTEGWQAWPRDAVPSDPTPDGMTWLKVRRTGLILLAKHPSLPRNMVDSPLGCATGSCRQAHEYDWGSLDLALSPLLDSKAHYGGVIGVLPHRGASVEVVVQALRSVIDFPRILLAGGDADGKPSRRSSRVVQNTVEQSWTATDEIAVIVTSLPPDLKPDDFVEYPRIGYLSKRLFSSRMAEYTPDARICYVQGLDHDPTVQGHISVQFMVQGDGAVTDLDVTDNALNDKRTTDCMVEMFQRMKFPSPQDRGPIRGSYTYTLTTDAQSDEPIAPEIGLRIFIRTMPVQPMIALVSHTRDAMLKCTSERDPGTLGMDIAIDQYGKVNDAVVTASPLSSPDLESCVARTLVGTKYTGESSRVYHAGLSWPSMEPSTAPPASDPSAEQAEADAESKAQ